MKKIIFTPKDELTETILTPPQPASKCVAEWYKSLSPYNDPSHKFHRSYDLSGNLTAKNCIPIFDSITSGYIIEFPCDIHFVKKESNFKNFSVLWDVSWEVISSHNEKQVGNMGIPDGFDRNAWKLIGNWRVKTPKGYSILYTHPFYRHDLPFFSSTGIVDSDVYDTEINIPFFLKNNFYGTIKKGTPVAQIIPIKRDSWKSEVAPYEINHRFINDKMRLISKGAYKKMFWQKKNYN